MKKPFGRWTSRRLKSQLPITKRSANHRIFTSSVITAVVAATSAVMVKNRQSDPMRKATSAVNKAKRSLADLAGDEIKEHGSQIVSPVLDLTKSIVGAVDDSQAGQKLVSDIEEYLHQTSPAHAGRSWES
jgi:7-keto-8-aminopelargonate synthetase-like enzyme